MNPQLLPTKVKYPCL